jgi:hypothetical protein
MTLSEAKKLHYGQTIYHKTHKNKDGTAQRWRVSGKIQTWKKDPKRIRIPVKHGLYSHDAITANELHLLTTKEPKRVKK